MDNNIDIHYQDIQTSDDNAFEGTIFIPINTKVVRGKEVKDAILDFMNRNSSFFEFGKLGLTPNMVMKFDIISNKTKDMKKYPELNISNENFAQLAQLLTEMGLEGIGENEGRISIEQLELAINSLNNDPDFLNNYTTEDSHEKENEGVEIYNFGTKFEQLERYIIRLQEMINFAHETGDEYINIS